MSRLYVGEGVFFWAKCVFLCVWTEKLKLYSREVTVWGYCESNKSLKRIDCQFIVINYKLLLLLRKPGRPRPLCKWQKCEPLTHECRQIIKQKAKRFSKWTVRIMKRDLIVMQKNTQILKIISFCVLEFQFRVYIHSYKLQIWMPLQSRANHSHIAVTHTNSISVKELELSCSFCLTVPLNCKMVGAPVFFYVFYFSYFDLDGLDIWVVYVIRKYISVSFLCVFSHSSI